MVWPQILVTKSTEETEALGRKLSDYLKGRVGNAKGSTPLVLCLYGALGSGKTTFVRGFAQGLGIKTRLLSPTFIIVRRYSFPTGYFLHIDLYRITPTDLAGLGLAEMLREPSAIVAIEWAEKLEKLMPERRVDISFSVLPGHKNKIQTVWRGYGERKGSSETVAGQNDGASLYEKTV